MIKKKRSPLKDLLFVSISSFIVAVAWIGFNIYNTWVTTTITPEMQVQITAIDPTFDTSLIKKLKVRKQVVPAMTLSGKIVDDTTATPTPSVVPSDVVPSVAAPADIAITPVPSAIVPAPSQATTQQQATISNIPVTVNGQ